MKKIGKYIKDFVLRGLCAMGFGPVVLGIVYFCLGKSGTIDLISYSEMVTGIFTIVALAFVAGGLTTIYQIDEIPLSVAIAAHGVILYIAYIVVYFINNWLEQGIKPLLVFSIIFVLGYIIVWTIIYFVTMRNVKKINKNLENE